MQCEGTASAFFNSLAMYAPSHGTGANPESDDNRSIDTPSTTEEQMLLSEQWVLVTGDPRPTIAAIGWARFQQQLDGSLKGSLNTIQADAADMRSRGFGRIVNAGTNLFQNPVVPDHDYTAVKSGAVVARAPFACASRTVKCRCAPTTPSHNQHFPSVSFSEACAPSAPPGRSVATIKGCGSLPHEPSRTIGKKHGFTFV